MCALKIAILLLLNDPYFRISPNEVKVTKIQSVINFSHAFKKS